MNQKDASEKYTDLHVFEEIMDRELQVIFDEFIKNKNISDEELARLINTDLESDSVLSTALCKRADEIRQNVYGRDVYIRGLIEFTNYCKNNCYYCGIRCGNGKVNRYRLTKEDILECCKVGYELGYRTFVLQGGEDVYFTDYVVCDIVSAIRNIYTDVAITLSIGEKSKESYEAYFKAGANRYLLRHETATEVHYSKLHPKELILANRKECLYNLKEIGYQVGAGFMVGSPYQTTENLVEDLRFLQDLEPDMIGIGPFIPHSETPFADAKQGSLELTLRMLSILRIMFPYVLLPSTTALGTIHPNGRELGLKAGANIVMPNLSPVNVRKLYELYENKICTGDEAAECRICLEKRVENAGYKIVTDRGDVKKEYK